MANNSSYITNETANDDIKDVSLTFKVCLGILLVSVSSIGILGNVLTCAIVYRKTPMRSAINLLLTNIASADFILSAVTTSFTFYRLLEPYSAIHLNVCIIVSVVKDVMVAVTSYTLLVVSADRFLIIVYKKDRLCVASAKTYTACVWCLSIVLALPQFISTIKKTVIYDNVFCSKVEPFYVNIQTAYTLIFLSVTFYFPLAVMFYLYASILRTVQLSSKRVSNHNGLAVSVSVTQYSNKMGLPPVATPYRFTGDFNAKRRAFGTILILYLAFAGCWLPYIAKRTEISLTGGYTSRDIDVSFVMMTIGLIKCALFPLILFFRNKRMRTACFRWFSCRICKPTGCLIIKSRRISPKTVYECCDSETRI